LSGSSPSSEKRRYWERRLIELLSTTSTLELLRLSWAIEAFREGRVEASKKVVVLPGDPSDHKLTRRYFIPPWSIDSVLNEKLVLGENDQRPARRLNLNSWSGIAKLFNTYSGLANAESTLDYDSEDIASAIQRLFWPQYNWQLGFANSPRLSRAWHMYATPEGKQAFLQKHGIELESFLKICFATFVGTEEYPAVTTSYLMQLGIERKEVRRALNVVGGSLSSQIENARSIRHEDIPRDFRRSVVKERPIFEFSIGRDLQFYVPSRESLFLRITDGLYFDIVSDSDARRKSGERFEEIVFDLVQHYFPDGVASRECKTSFGVSSDIILKSHNDREITIFECKSRRLPQRILTSPKPWEEFKDDYSDLAKGIVQIWRTYAELGNLTDQNGRGLLVLFDPWTLLGSSFLDELIRMASKRADALSIPKEARIPIAISDYFDLEICLRKNRIDEIQEAVRLANTEQYFGYSLSSVCSEVSSGSVSKERFDYSKIAQAAVPWWGED